MHPALIHWWKARQAGDCGSGWASASCGPGAQAEGGERYPGWRQGPSERYAGGHGGDGDELGWWGLRGPAAVALPGLQAGARRTPGRRAGAHPGRAQDRARPGRGRSPPHAVGLRRRGGRRDLRSKPRAKEAADLRVATAERLRDAVTKALAPASTRLLDNDQRERLAYLIRTGTLAALGAPLEVGRDPANQRVPPSVPRPACNGASSDASNARRRRSRRCVDNGDDPTRPCSTRIRAPSSASPSR